MLMSAGSSPAGACLRGQAHVDCLFMVITEDSKYRVRCRAGALRAGRERCGLYASGDLLCRRTAKETKDYYHYLVREKGDSGGGRASYRQARGRQFTIAVTGADAQDEGAGHQRRRDLPGDRQLR